MGCMPHGGGCSPFEEGVRLMEEGSREIGEGKLPRKSRSQSSKMRVVLNNCLKWGLAVEWR